LPELTFTIDFFVNSQCDPSGGGEGQTFLGSTSSTSNSGGDASFSVSLPLNIPAGQVATATATDPSGNTSQFSTCEAVQQVAANLPPIANAGPNQTVTVGTLVMLDGTGSSDPDNGPSPLTFTWTQTSGPTVTLTGANTATPGFTPTQTGMYVFSLVVNDGLADSAPATVTITVVSGTPQQQIKDLIAQVKSLDLEDRLERRLVLRLSLALIAVNSGNNQLAIGQMRLFIAMVNLHKGKEITDQQATDLITAAQLIIQTLQRNP
jgi:hypothetical protein